MVIDEIDRTADQHDGCTDPPCASLWRAREELDFIINYDIKYRMGDALEAD